MEPRGRTLSGRRIAVSRGPSSGGGSGPGSSRRGRVIQGKVVGKPKVVPQRTESVGAAAPGQMVDVAEAVRRAVGGSGGRHIANGGNDPDDMPILDLTRVRSRACGAAPSPGPEDPPGPPDGPEYHQIGSSSESDVDVVMASWEAQYEFNQTQIDARTVSQQNLQVIVNEDPARILQAADVMAQGREGRAAASAAVAAAASTMVEANARIGQVMLEERAGAASAVAALKEELIRVQSRADAERVGFAEPVGLCRAEGA